ncbi:phage holin family protein [Nocardia sp. NPDC005978]|uniref:phage holin family protein n=1 Tax=Nocardia sp. NPDC005978 TaxID=3156725 RepID=UPI0033BCCB19
MADHHNYGTALRIPPSPFERAARELFAEFTAWLAPRAHRARKAVLAELARAVFVMATLGFALVAAAYGTIYFFAFLVELLGQWMPHWAALGLTSAIMLVPAGIAALLGVWQIFRLRSVRAARGAAGAANAALVRFGRRNSQGANSF